MEEPKDTNEERRAARAPMMPYWQALGEFVDSFARLETILKHALIKMLGLSDPVGRVVTAGLRADTLATYITRVNELTPFPGSDPEFVDQAIKQFSGINTVRNAILHSGATDSISGWIRITNTLTARTPKRAREFLIEPMQIKAMTSDLVKLLAYFGLFVVPVEIRPKMMDRVQPLLDRPWRSRPHELMNRSPENPKGSHK